jgi:CRP-like cAMP-binding protein
MAEIEILKCALKSFADLDEEDFNLSSSFWLEKEFKKGDFFNEYQHISKYLGFVIEGVFRGYLSDMPDGSERNVFLMSRNHIVCAYKSLIQQTPCNYTWQALVDSKIFCIHVEHLTWLYQHSHRWEHFGRLVAEYAFYVTLDRAESFLFKTPEERYLKLIEQHPDIFEIIPLYHISSYLGIEAPSLSRIRKRLTVSKEINRG